MDMMRRKKALAPCRENIYTYLAHRPLFPKVAFCFVSIHAAIPRVLPQSWQWILCFQLYRGNRNAYRHHPSVSKKARPIA